jgi:hypothetical protein
MEANLVLRKLCRLLPKLILENSKLITQVVHKVLLENHHHSKNDKNNQMMFSQSATRARPIVEKKNPNDGSWSFGDEPSQY